MYEQEQRHWWFRAKGRFIRGLLKKEAISARAVLDAGCGTGHNMKFLQAERDYVGVDVSADAARFCRTNGMKEVAQASLDQLPLRDACFDLVLSLDVLEHTDDPSRVVRELARVMKPQGRLLVTVPAFRFLWSAHDEAISHLRRYSRADLKRLLEDEGWTIERDGYFYGLTFLPVALVRLARNLFPAPKNPRSDTFRAPPAWINESLDTLMRIEAAMARWFRLPFGTSVFALAALARRSVSNPATAGTERRGEMAELVS